jgi:hypothetical protein
MNVNIFKNKKIIFLWIALVCLLLIPRKNIIENITNKKTINVDESLRFFLYSENEIDNFFNYLGVYSKEIYDVLKDHPQRVSDPHKAHIFITCFSNETNYPIFGKQYLGQPSKTLSEKEMISKCCYISYGYHITFFHNSDKVTHPFINIPYMSKSKKTILLPPPAITNITFNNTLKRHILVSFKGNFNRKSFFDNKDYRNLIIKSLKKFESKKIIIESRHFKKYSYKYLLHNSIFSLVIEGDLPWSYRLTEIINSGSIPIIILPKHSHILPFQQILDYSKFSILLHYDEIDTFFNERLNHLDYKYIQHLQYNLYNVNKQIFINRKTQFNSLLNCIEYSFKRDQFPYNNINDKISNI